MLSHFPAPLVAKTIFVFVIATGTHIDALAQNPRRTPAVAAIEKARTAQVAVMVPNPDGGRPKVGSGVIIDPAGYIVTNYHVTDGKKNVRIRLHDKTECIGQVIVADHDRDLAVIRIKTSVKLSALTIAPATDLMVGETVFAVGNPFGYEGTVSRGIISALGREIHMPNDVLMKNLIQHDAAINPGSSGGPLVNVDAELIGINIGLRDGAQNIAFAIHADTIDDALSQLLGAQRIAGVHHGLQCRVKEGKNITPPRNIVVSKVMEQSPSAKAGVMVGDIVLCVSDMQVHSRFELERAFWDRKPSEKVPIKIRRNGLEKSVSLELSEVSSGK